MQNKTVFSVLVNNHSGVLSRISGLFSRRGYNITSLSVGETGDPAVSRITLQFSGDEGTARQLESQLRKLYDVTGVHELSPEKSVFRELVLVKVNAGDAARASILEVAGVFRARVDDLAAGSMVLELTGDTGKVEAFLTLMKPYGIRELARTGLTALSRGTEEPADKT